MRHARAGRCRPLGAVFGSAILVSLLAACPGAAPPELVGAWVAVQTASDGVPTVGDAEVPAGTALRLFAVLEARDSAGESFFYTEAPRLILHGREVPPEQLRTWDRDDRIRCLWLTIEGAVPYVELESEAGLDRFVFEAFSHPEWGQGWTATASVSARRDDDLAEGEELNLAFGTQRYQVWIERFESPKSVLADERLRSPGPEGLLRQADAAAADPIAADPVSADPADPAAADLAGVPREPPRVTATEPGLSAASAVFGLTQMEPAAGAGPDLRSRLDDLARRRLVFHRASLLADILASAGTSLRELRFERLDLAAGERWGVRVRAGDLVQVGARWVVLYRDANDDGVLDGEDLCFDFERGAVVRRLSTVFVGTGDVEWASLSG